MILDISSSWRRSIANHSIFFNAGMTETKMIIIFVRLSIWEKRKGIQHVRNMCRKVRSPWKTCQSFRNNENTSEHSNPIVYFASTSQSLSQTTRIPQSDFSLCLSKSSVWGTYIWGKSVDDLFDLIAGSEITVPDGTPGADCDTVTYVHPRLYYCSQWYFIAQSVAAGIGEAPDTNCLWNVLCLCVAGRGLESVRKIVRSDWAEFGS